MFRIPIEKLREEGLKRRTYIERYNLYKATLRTLAAEQDFDLLDEYFSIPPGHYMQIKFFIPVPRTWRIWKRNEMHLKIHNSTPDFDNFCKAFCDGLLPHRDKVIGDVRISKYYFYNPSDAYYDKVPKGQKNTNKPNGHIEVWQRIDA